MKGTFVLTKNTAQEVLDWGQLRWLSNPPTTDASVLTVIEVVLSPGKGHDFHKHPDQEEVIYAVSGKIEQWVDDQRQDLSPGDSVFIPAGTVHASFNSGDTDAKVLAILGPSVGDLGYEIVDVSGEAPWNTLRSTT